MSDDPTMSEMPPAENNESFDSAASDCTETNSEDRPSDGCGGCDNYDRYDCCGGDDESDSDY